MRRILVFAFLCICGGGGRSSSRRAPRRTTGAPKLVVVVVVDQMRATIGDIRPSWRAGLQKLLGEGAYFEHAEYPYMNTVTCAGHATIGNGNLPAHARHGP
jgi:hypothetical protein